MQSRSSLAIPRLFLASSRSCLTLKNSFLTLLVPREAAILLFTALSRCTLTLASSDAVSSWLMVSLWISTVILCSLVTCRQFASTLASKVARRLAISTLDFSRRSSRARRGTAASLFAFSSASLLLCSALRSTSNSSFVFCIACAMREARSSEARYSSLACFAAASEARSASFASLWTRSSRTRVEESLSACERS